MELKGGNSFDMIRDMDLVFDRLFCFGRWTVLVYTTVLNDLWAHEGLKSGFVVQME